MRQIAHFFLTSALLLSASAAVPHGVGEKATRAAHACLYAQRADHSLLQIMLAAPSATSKTSLSKSREGAWNSSSDVLCVDVSPLRKAIETRGVRELPGEARKQARRGSWLQRLARGDVVLLGMVSIAELRSARVQREAAVATHATDQVKRVVVPAEDTVYGAPRVESASLKSC
jgi:hypothetical protein